MINVVEDKFYGWLVDVFVRWSVARLMDLSYNDVKRGLMMLHEVWLAREKRRANQITCKFHFSAFDVIMRKVYWLIGWSVGWMVGWLISWLVGSLIGEYK